LATRSKGDRATCLDGKNLSPQYHKKKAERAKKKWGGKSHLILERGKKERRTCNGDWNGAGEHCRNRAGQQRQELGGGRRKKCKRRTGDDGDNRGCTSRNLRELGQDETCGMKSGPSKDIYRRGHAPGKSFGTSRGRGIEILPVGRPVRSGFVPQSQSRQEGEEKF